MNLTAWIGPAGLLVLWIFGLRLALRRRDWWRVLELTHPLRWQMPAVYLCGGMVSYSRSWL
jgi:hypothetical protein